MPTSQSELKPARRSRWLLVAVIAGFVGAGVFRALLTPALPSYQGKTIHDWWPEVCSSNADTNKPVAVAMRHMGTNAFPKIFSEFRVSVVQNDDDEWFVSLVRKLPRGWLAYLPYQLKTHAAGRHSDAEMAFAMLGPERTNALPELRRLAEQGRLQGMSCLLLCGPEGAAVVLDQLRSTNRANLLAAVRALGWYQPQARALIFRHVTAAEVRPVHKAMRSRITALATHPDLEIRHAVAGALIRSRVEWGQPLIERMLTDPDLNGPIQAELKDLTWWEAYNSTNLPPAKPLP